MCLFQHQHAFHMVIQSGYIRENEITVKQGITILVKVTIHIFLVGDYDYSQFHRNWTTCFVGNYPPFLLSLLFTTLFSLFVCLFVCLFVSFFLSFILSFFLSFFFFLFGWILRSTGLVLAECVEGQKGAFSGGRGPHLYELLSPLIRATRQYECLLMQQPTL